MYLFDSYNFGNRGGHLSRIIMDAETYLRERLAANARQFHYEEEIYKREVYCVGPVNGEVVRAASERLQQLRREKTALTGSIKFYEKQRTESIAGPQGPTQGSLQRGERVASRGLSSGW
jgi:hypothetical protein